MIKNLSIRFKITFWFTAALLLAALFSCIIVLSVSGQILQKTIRDNLVEAVTYNFDEIHFYPDEEDVDFNKDASRFLRFEEGFLEVQDDFLDEVNQVYTALYNSDQVLLYGENPISRDTSGVDFSDSRIQRIKVNKITYYIFDRTLETKGLSGLWMRGVVSEEQGSVQMNTITRISLIILPLLVLTASVGGYLIVRRMFRPIQEISETAREIGRENDLKKRICLGRGKDELHQLADTFNDTFDKLEKAFETERRFISDASHELRTPMSVITSQCEYTLESPRSPEEYEDALRVILRQGQRMSKLIGDMLDFTRLENGAERYPMEEIDLTRLVSSVCSDMALIRENGITLRHEEETDVRLRGNHALLTRLLVNLIGNAYRYGKPEGHIQVDLRTEGQKICLFVADDGIGIAKEDQEKIFQRFYQADSSRSGTGTGLGLSLAQEIARFHGGEIRVESEPQKGSTFFVIF